MAMTFQLKDFDGPLDLLLHLISKAQIDIKDIFVSEITDQYIAFVRSAPDLDMDDASEFLVMAATLLEIKSRAMLPKPPAPEEGEVDPEEELIRRLEEYRRFKETAIEMQGFENTAKALFTKLPDEFPLPPPEVELVGLTLDGLVEAFARIWARRTDREEIGERNRYAARDIRRDEHSVQECMLTLLHGIRKRGSLHFEEVFSDAPTKEEVVTLFLALLELMRLGRAHAEQDSVYGGIILKAGSGKSAKEQTDD
ncbi:MAG: segregation/condensation protein A [Clostridia bacterium]|nr:segregation/condensation protein A [Clostridia bacterium]